MFQTGKVAPIALVAALAANVLRAQTSSVDGTTFDSLAHRALAGARVQLFGPIGTAPHSYSAVSDSTGHFHLDALPRGLYDAGFFHPVLDAAGLELPARRLDLRRDHESVALATPSGAKLTSLLCPETKLVDSTGTLIGFVRDASSELPLSGVRVRAEWTATTIENKQIKNSAIIAATETSASGWFALCGVPSATVLSIRAEGDRDSSGVVQVEIGVNDVSQATLYVAHIEGGADASHARVPMGRVSGAVVDDKRKPVLAATVTVWDTKLMVTTDDRGMFTLDSVPAGSQTVEVRAIGSAPATKIVNLLAGQTATVIVALTRAVVLEKVETRAETEAATLLAPFESHRKSAAGGFFIKPTETDRVAANPLQRWARMAPGVNVVQVKTDGLRWHALMYPSAVRGNQPTCDPSIFVNGMQQKLSFDDIVTTYTADDILGFEIYAHHAEVPTDYHVDALGACGAIAIWVQPKFKKADEKKSTP